MGLLITTIPSGKAALLIPGLNIVIKESLFQIIVIFFKRWSGMDGLINGWMYGWVEGGRIILFERPFNGILSTQKN